jgi:hypothetical protein
MMVKDTTTGVMRPYDPDLDYDLPLAQLGTIPPDPDPATARPLNPARDLNKGTK